MVQLALVFLAATLVSIQASPLLEKRINQVIAQSTAKWVAQCQNTAVEFSANWLKCNPLSVAAMATLLANAGDCDQQNAADNLVDLSNALNSTEMVALAQIFMQQPRNSPTGDSVPYCQQAPRNTELNGLYQCQFQGVNSNLFVGGLAVGTTGTIPFNLSSAVDPPGSCPANPSGTILDGEQLSNITTNPFASGSSSTPTVRIVSPSGSSVTPSGTQPPPTSPTAPAAASPSSSFQLANGRAAQKLNAQYAALTADSPCNAGENACVNSEFVQCVSGKFVSEPCGATLSCYALPLVNSLGTSIACTTEENATQRIAASGATGGITG